MLAGLGALANFTTIATSAGDAVDAVKTAVKKSTDKAKRTLDPTTYVFIIIGLLLIAAGIFQFDKARTIIVGAGKKAVEAGAVAAA